MSNWTSLTDGLNSAALTAFGREVLYVPKVGESKTVAGILETVQQPEPTNPGLWGVLFLKLSDLDAAPAAGDKVEIGALTYNVFEIQADGAGGVKLGLHK